MKIFFSSRSMFLNHSITSFELCHWLTFVFSRTVSLMESISFCYRWVELDNIKLNEDFLFISFNVFEPFDHIVQDILHKKVSDLAKRGVKMRRFSPSTQTMVASPYQYTVCSAKKYTEKVR